MSSAITPLLIGFFSGFHCVMMCGGLCAVMCQRQNHTQNLLTNLGRITTYTLLGALFAGVIQGASLTLNLGNWGGLLRLLMGLTLIISGLVMVFKSRAKWLLIQKPLPFWNQISNTLKKLSHSNTNPAAYAKGLLWGLIPCGLLYGMLIIAATTADVLRGASFMLFFGLGTLIPLLLSQALMQRWLNSGSNQTLRTLTGSLIILLGLWVALAPWFSHLGLPTDSVWYTELSAVMALCVP